MNIYMREFQIKQECKYKRDERGELMHKKVLAINSSLRKMNTYGILEKLKNELRQKQINVDIINLFDYDIKECIGCEQYLRGKTCAHID